MPLVGPSGGGSDLKQEKGCGQICVTADVGTGHSLASGAKPTPGMDIAKCAISL